MSQGVFLRKYGVPATIDFDLFEVDGVDFRTNAVHASGDSKVMKNEGAENNTINSFLDEGQSYSLTLTSAEMTAARVKVLIVDQTSPKVWLDTTITIETYGHASAQHAFDLGSAKVTLADGAHGGTAAVLTLERAIIASATADQPGIKVDGDGTGSGIELTGGATGHGLECTGGGTSGDGVRALGVATGEGIGAYGGANGSGVLAKAGATLGHGIRAEGTVKKSISIPNNIGDGLFIGNISGDLTGGVGSVAAEVTANVTKLGGDAAALATLLAMYQAITKSTVDDATFTPTTTAFEADLTEATDDHFNDQVCVFATGVLAGQAKKITDYDGTEKRLTTEAFTEAPSDGDQFLIVGLVA